MGRRRGPRGGGRKQIGGHATTVAATHEINRRLLLRLGAMPVHGARRVGGRTGHEVLLQLLLLRGEEGGVLLLLLVGHLLLLLLHLHLKHHLLLLLMLLMLVH
jgi:hypothetical protein